ncbi:MAG: KdsC family phosphatase [Phycisphaerales bacterium]
MDDARAARIRLLCLDVDGILTDGGIIIDTHGVETKRFDVRDGIAIRAWKALGHEVAIITGRSSMCVTHRAEELDIRLLAQGVSDKRAMLLEMTRSLELEADEVAAMGDDWADISMLRACGYAMTVSDAAKEVKAIAAFTTVRPGGRGAVREAIEHLVRARGEWETLLQMYES